jgi:hypothetical protein
MLMKEAEYNMDGSTEWYSLYTVLGDSADYYDFVSGTMGDYQLRLCTIEEEHKLKTDGEYYPTVSQPYMVFWQYDATNDMPKVGFRPKSATETVYLRYLRKPVTMDGSNDSCLPEYCDDAILYYAAYLSWAGYREITERQMWLNQYKEELRGLIEKYAQNVWGDVWYHPVS